MLDDFHHPLNAFDFSAVYQQLVSLALRFLFSASNLRLLQALLDVDLESGLVSVTTGPGLVGPRPLGFQDGALYPLGFRGAQCLTIALSGLLFQVGSTCYSNVALMLTQFNLFCITVITHC